MREITIGGQAFEVRGLRLSEVSAAKMRKLGYGRFVFAPDLGDGPDAQQDRLGDVMDAALLAVFGKDVMDEIDRAGGVAGLHAAFRAIIAETYGGPGEEKNSSSAGSGSPTPSGSNTAASAENPAKTGAMDAASAASANTGPPPG